MGIITKFTHRCQSQLSFQSNSRLTTLPASNGRSYPVPTTSFHTHSSIATKSSKLGQHGLLRTALLIKRLGIILSTSSPSSTSHLILLSPSTDTPITTDCACGLLLEVSRTIRATAYSLM